MIFKVSSELKGSLVLKTLGAPLYAGKTISISGDNLYANDVKVAIQKNVLVPESGQAYESEKNKESQVLIINKQNRVLILDTLTIGPYGTMFADRKFAKSDIVRRASINGFIDVVLEDEGQEFSEVEAESVEKAVEEPVEVPVDSIKSKNEIFIDVDPTEEEIEAASDKLVEEKMEQDQPESTAVIWDFRAQELTEAKKVPKPGQTITVGEETGDGEEPDTTKKEENQVEIKKPKTEESVSPEKSVKVKESLQNLIDDIKDDGVVFVDKQQTVEQVVKRGMGDKDVLKDLFE